MSDITRGCNLVSTGYRSHNVSTSMVVKGFVAPAEIENPEKVFDDVFDNRKTAYESTYGGCSFCV